MRKAKTPGNAAEGNKRTQQNDGTKGRRESLFRGKTEDMQGNVFQVHGEPRKRGEFKNTLEALERYGGKYYPLDTTLLQPIFKELKEPMVEPPKTPGTKSIETEDGVKLEEEGVTTEWDRVMYTEEVKLYLRNRERLTATLIALYNVV